MSEIDTMPAGPEMDRLVAERVMGWKWDTPPDQSLPGGWRFHFNGWYHYGERPWWEGGGVRWEPSANIAHAWEVVERHGSWQVSTYRDGSHTAIVYWGSMTEVGHADGHGETAALAICRAALRARALHAVG